MHTYQKVYKTGNSIGMAVPAKFARYLGIKPGHLVKVEQDRLNAKLICTFVGVRQLPLENNK